MSFPDFYEKAPVVRTRDSFAEVLGAATDGMLEYRYLDAVRLAGHSCPTVAGAFLMGRAALAALYPGEPAERGGITVRMPAPEHEGTTGVMAQVLTLLTGAAADNGFHGIQGRYRRKGLLSFAEQREGEAIIFTRLDNGKSVAISLNVSLVPAIRRKVRAWQPFSRIVPMMPSASLSPPPGKTVCGDCYWTSPTIPG